MIRKLALIGIMIVVAAIALTMFKTIGDRLGPFDLTLIETGAYNASWTDIHLITRSYYPLVESETVI